MARLVQEKLGQPIPDVKPNGLDDLQVSADDRAITLVDGISGLLTSIDLQTKQVLGQTDLGDALFLTALSTGP